MGIVGERDTLGSISFNELLIGDGSYRSKIECVNARVTIPIAMHKILNIV